MIWFNDTEFNQTHQNYLILLLFVLFGLFFPDLLSKLEGEYEAPIFTQDLINLELVAGPWFIPDMDLIELSVRSGMVFAVITTLGFVMGFWDDISPWIMAGLNKLFSVVLGFRWLIKQLAVVRSYQGLRTTLLLTLNELKQSTTCRLLCRVPFEAILWLYSAPDPLVMIIRLMALGFFGVVACITLCLCGGQLLSGFAAGLFSTQWDMGVYCSFSPRNYFYLPSGRGRLLAEFHCFGRNLGVNLNGVVDENQALLDSHQDEWSLLPTVLLALVCVLAWMYYVLSETVAAEQTSQPEPEVQAQTVNCIIDQGAQTDDSAVLERERQLEAEMHALIKEHASECESYKKTIKAQEERIAADAARQLAMKQREEYGAFFGTLPAPRVSFGETSYTTSNMEPRQRDITRSHLEEQAERKNTQLEKMQEELVEVSEDRDFLSQRARVLEAKGDRAEDELQRYRSAKVELERQQAKLMAQAEAEYVDAMNEVHSLRDCLLERDCALDNSMQRVRELEILSGQGGQVYTQLEERYYELVSRHDALLSSNEALCKERSDLLIEIEMSKAFDADPEPAKKRDADPEAAEERGAANQRCELLKGEIKSLEDEVKALEGKAGMLESERDGGEALYQGTLAWAKGVDENCRAALAAFGEDRDRRLADLETALEDARAKAALSDHNARQVDHLEGKLSNAETETRECRQEIGRLERIAQPLRNRVRELEEAARLSQGTPQKRRTSDMGSIVTALEKSRVEVVELQNELRMLRSQSSLMVVEPSDQAKDEFIRTLQGKLDNERRMRAAAQTAANIQVSALDKEIRSLKSDLSDAKTRPGASPFNRSNGRRRPF
ncbi:hypothetical protein N8T08_003068 [Aspergillus melleus]|uniref:Uncharacterized protein n=1 Tax=Aspergillus melleus TaxID=138277 RepID=A0ACC3B7G0_9EURO|nr:hypothetical protein N8T08_003068 [Aspergillus melleus]